MRRKTRFWFLLGLVLIVAAALFWQFGGRRDGARRGDSAASSTSAPQPFNLQFTNFAVPANAMAKQMFVTTNPPNAVVTNRLAYRLSNTKQPFEQLVRNDRAVLLRNAFIDTALPDRPAIPEHLKSKGDPGSYVVQVREAITEPYRDWLVKAGAEIISYIPNNAFLVRASAAVAGNIAALPDTQAVLPFEPYYKFDSLLLPLVVNQQLSPHGQLNVVSFPHAAEQAKAQLEKLGAEVLRDPEPTLLGEVLVVKAPADSLAAIAQIPEVQMVGVHFDKMPLNDLSRVKLRVSKTSTNRPPPDPKTTQYAAPTTNDFLTGQGVLVAVADTGADIQHPDLVGRVVGPNANTDFDGHGTHVIGSLLGDGTASPLTASNALGSFSNAIFSGIAPKAKAYVQDLIGPDIVLQTNTALTNALISNNSWGYPLNDYDIFAASYDAAVRDSLPGATGEQEVMYVFAAGNDGGGGNDGLNGIAGSVLSPATAKNVITVGGADQARFISNVVVRCTTNTVGTNVVYVCTTNRPWLGQTDSDNQVSPYSARGNVGIGIEGPFGRFKPDVVAPGSMVVSTRSAQFVDPEGTTNTVTYQYNNVSFNYAVTNLFSLNIPGNAVGVRILLISNALSPQTNIDVAVGWAMDTLPTAFATNTLDRFTNTIVTIDPTNSPVLQPGTLYYSIVNVSSNNSPAIYDLVVRLVLTNDVGTYYDELKKLNAPLKPYYRYESGTSMAAPKISGMLALIQEFLAGNSFNRRPSPALLKALIINGARSVSANYNLDARAAINHQGWGIASISNSVPSGMSADPTKGPVRFYDQDITNGLATGGTQVYQVNVPNSARSYPLRVTLVWSDPPGNPVSSIKLVNDLNLLVTGGTTNVIGGATNTNSLVWAGNNFPAGSDFTAPIIAASSDPDAEISTNLVADIENARDLVNNVENVYIAPPLASTYTVIVKAHRVNVNALNSHSNSIAQDYALVISSGNVAPNTNVNVTATGPVFTNDASSRISALVRQTNANARSAGLLNQRVGANSALIVSTNGATNQWAFFTYTNVSTVNFTNVAILTFLPPQLSLARYREADIDLYVTRDGQGGNASLFFDRLDPGQVSLAKKATSRAGTEFVVFNDAQPDEVFYIGVKSEDQQAAQFSIYAVSSDQPFSRRESNNVVATAFPLPADIPDGTADNPGGTNLFAIVTEPDVVVRRVYVTNSIFHEQAGDLIGIFSHRDPSDGSDASVVLNNHRTWNGFTNVVYDDSEEGDLEDPGNPAYSPLTSVIPPDGPGRLQDFAGQQAYGVWNFSISDNAMFHTGYVDNFTLVIEPASTNGPDPINIVFGVNPGRFFYVPVNVPFDAYNMEICVSEIQPIPNDPIEIYVRQGTRPTTNTYDFATNTMPPGLCLNIGLGDTPPLTPGRWFIGIYNPATNPRETMRLRVTFSRQAIPGPYFTYTSTDTPKTLLDDAVTNSTILVTNRGRISDLRVGLRVDHERASDLVFHLVSPSRTRLLLMENRGRTNALGIGANVTNIVTNVVRQVFNNGFENARQQLYVAGNKVSGWNVDSGQVDVMTFVTNTGTRFDGAAPHSGTNMLDSRGFIPGSISTNVLLQPLKTYRLSFAFCRNPDSRTVIYNNVVPEADVRVAGTNLIHIYADQINTWSNMNWQTTSVVFQASVATNKMEIVSVGQGADASGVMFDTVRIDEIEIKTNLYIYTTFTENTNLTDTPIKFGQPPYTNSVSPLSRPVLDDGFDFGYNGTAPFGFSGCCISGWTVESGDIDVIVDNGSGLGRPADTPPFAIDSGGDGAGVVVTNLFLERGADYTLSFAFSKGDTNAFFTPQAEVELTGVGTFLVTAVNGAGWDQTNIDFTAQSAATTLRLRSFNAGSGVYFDSFKIRRKAFSSSVADAYFLPEESIKPFFGQQAYGPWTLEVWDNRLGGAVTGTPQLVSWKLDIAFVPTNPPFVRLTNGSSVTAWVTNDAVLYFSVDVPCTEGFATNTLSCLTPTTVNGLNLTFNQYVLPTNGPNDVLLLSGVTQPLSPSNAVLTIGQAPLVSATRYYLAVANVNPAETNEFQIAINFACVPPAIGLSNYVCYSNRIASGEFQIYQYTVRPNVVQATFEITDSTGDTDLYLRAGARPTLFRYDYATNTPNWGNEVIAVGTNSIPTPINTVFAGGLWYIGVTNATTNALPAPVTYCIKVTEIVAPEIRQFVLVSDGACGGSNTVNTGSTGFADYYLVTIPPNPQNALFQVDVNQGAADLFVRNDFWPTTNSQPRSIGMSTEQIFLNPGSTPIPLSAGDWFISVIHPNPTTFVNHDLFISISATCPSPFIESSSSSYTTDGFALKWNAPASQEFEVQYTDTLSPVNWTTITKVTSTNGQFEFLDTGARTNTAGQRFYRLLRVQ